MFGWSQPPQGASYSFLKIVFFQSQAALNHRVGAVAPTMPVMTFKLLWQKVGFMGLMAVPGMSFHAEIDQLIIYSPHNNSQTETLKQNRNTLGTFQCSLKWSDILWWAWHMKPKSVRFAGPAPPTNTWWRSPDAHYLQTSSMHPEKEEKLESGPTFLKGSSSLKSG